MKVIINLNYNLLQQMNMISIFSGSCQKLVSDESYWDGVSQSASC
jgi:hypothetical protein